MFEIIEQRVHARWTLVVKGEETLLQLIDATDAAAVNNTDTRGILGFHIKAGFSQRLIRCRDGVLHETLETARFFLAQAVFGAIVAANLSCVVNLESRSVEALDRADAALTRAHRVPQRLNANASRRNRACSSDDDATRTIGAQHWIHKGNIQRTTHSDKPPSTAITWPVT